MSFDVRRRWDLTVSCGVTIIVAAFLAGCGRHDHAHDHHDHDVHGGQSHGHDHGRPAAHGDDPGTDHEHSSGVEFVQGRGLVIPPATRQSIGLRTVRAERRAVPREIRFTVQVFGEQHRHHAIENDHSGCDVHGSALLPHERSQQIEAGQRVELLGRTNGSPQGVVLAASQAPALGELELVIGFSNAAAMLRPGDFLPARVRIDREAHVVAIPAEAVLRTAEGTFVYVEADAAFQRRRVLVGSEADGWSEIVTGLSESEIVAREPVQTLWLAELRATRGGGHSH